MKAKRSLDSVALIQWICVLIMLVMVGLLCVPYWHYDGQSTSVNGYIWFPSSKTALNLYFEAELGRTVFINDEIITPILLSFLGIVGLVLKIMFKDTPLAAMVAILFGAAGIYGYLASDVLKLGTMWGTHFAMCIAALVLGLVGVILFLVKFFSVDSKG